MDEITTAKTNSDGSAYWGWALLTGIVVFICVWIYAISEWGLLLGLMFGWIPALIGGAIAGLLWPIVAIAATVIIYLILKTP